MTSPGDPAYRRSDFEETAVAGARPPEGAPLAAGDRPIEELGSLRDRWTSAIAGAISGRVAESRRLEFADALRVEAGRTVHRAVELDLEREVEVHFPAEGTPESTFEAAARVLARIAGPAVPRLYDSGTDPHGRPYLVLAVPPGEPLRAVLDRLGDEPASAAPRRELLAALVPVARALDRAHREGIAHLAVRPDTIVIGRHGQVALTGWVSPEALVGSWGKVADELPPEEQTAHATKWESHRPAADSSILELDESGFHKTIESVGESDPRVTAALYEAPEIRHGRQPAPTADVYSLGLVTSAVAFGSAYRPVRRRRYRDLLPGAPPELVAVVRCATERRPSRRYESGEALAADLERALSGLPVAAGGQSFPRRAARHARRHPYAVVAGSMVAVAGLVLGSYFWLDHRERRVASDSERRAREESALAEASSHLQRARRAAERLDSLIAAEDDAFGPMRRELADLLAPGQWDPPIAGRAPPGRSAKDALDAATLGSRESADEALAAARDALGEIDRVAGLEGPRAEIDALVVRVALARFDAESARAILDEDATLSSRTLGQVRAREPVARWLEARLSGDLRRDRESYDAALGRLAASWYEAAVLLERALELVGPRAERHGLELAGAIQALRTNATIRIGEIPEELTATIAEVDNSGPAFVIGPAEPVESGESRSVLAGEYVLSLADGKREVRHDVMVGAGDQFEWTPDWPREWPPGDFVYVPPGEFRAGGGSALAGPYRTERIDCGFFMARHETTLGEYLEFLRGIQESTTQNLPGEYLLRDPFAEGDGRYVTVVNLSTRVIAVAIREYAAEMPATSVSCPGARKFAERLTAEKGGDWTYRLPSEAQWEYAARGAAGRVLPWGDVWAESRANVRRYEEGVFPLERAGATPRGESVFAIRDLAGNVSEWTLSVDEGAAVLRGPDCWRSARRQSLTRQRAGLGASFDHDPVGFRVVCVRR